MRFDPDSDDPAERTEGAGAGTAAGGPVEPFAGPESLRPDGEALLPVVLGVLEGGPGPLLIVNSGIHGNEPAGVEASRRVLAELSAAGTRVRGRVVFTVGNRIALARDQRFVDRDLNRGWSAGAIADLRARPADGDGSEDRMQREMLAVFEAEIHAAGGGARVAFLDLHTSSADGPPFTCLADTIENRRWALALPIPVILGLEETIDGAVMEWFEDRGIAALAVEGGRHRDPAAVSLLADVIRISLVEHGHLPADGPVDRSACLRRLRAASAGRPRIVEVVFRHERDADDDFVMRPGFTSFDEVRAGTPLAEHRGAVVAAPSRGRVLLPLYQGQGTDGFFFARPVARIWLVVSRVVRFLGLPRLVTLLPGVRRDPVDPLALVVDRRVARWFVVEVFHLLGFRRKRLRDDGFTLSFRRRVTRRPRP